MERQFIVTVNLDPRKDGVSPTPEEARAQVEHAFMYQRSYSRMYTDFKFDATVLPGEAVLAAGATLLRTIYDSGIAYDNPAVEKALAVFAAHTDGSWPWCEPCRSYHGAKADCVAARGA